MQFQSHKTLLQKQGGRQTTGQGQTEISSPGWYNKVLNDRQAEWSKTKKQERDKTGARGNCLKA
jgi:hypothetical protein